MDGDGAVLETWEEDGGGIGISRSCDDVGPPGTLLFELFFSGTKLKMVINLAPDHIGNLGYHGCYQGIIFIIRTDRWVTCPTN